MEIGSRLKEAREQKNISLEELQEKTKIQKRYLQAVEQGDYHILPGTFYARAFIKEYAAAVGLNGDDLLEEFKDELPQTKSEETPQYTRIQRSRKDNHPTKQSAIFSIIPTVITVLLVIGIIFAAWYFIQLTISNDDQEDREPVEESDDNEIIISDESNEPSTDDESESTPENEEENDNQAEQDNSEEEAKEMELRVVEEGTGTVPESTFEVVNGADDMILTLESTDNSWLEVNNGEGDTFYSNPFTPEESPLEIDISDEDRIYLNIGSAPNLQITINETLLEYPVDPDSHVHQKIWINLTESTE
ncbi:helix-turn-helix domain-containing protein [Oceanobacillus halotolerans]|uniref:helix-turn-helix domain-containing protein n=1 Tax=Oceanobacillus halotolerans TaxID=2663380 RepID=UPI0013DCB449|nr:RodZ family helix-turn-helix domain-containing protein [Oceanobacillus halotolerans]